MNIIHLDKWIRQLLLGFLISESVSLVQQEAQVFVDEFLENKKIDKVHEILEGLKKEKQENIWLVSATISPVANAIASKLAIKNYIATEMEIKNEHYSGKIINDLEGRKEFELSNYKIDNYIVYTDSKKDKHLVIKSQEAYIICNSTDLIFWNNLGKEKNHILII